MLTLSVPVVFLNSPNLSPYFSLNKFERISLLIFSSLLCLISSHFLITKCLILYVLCEENLGVDNWLGLKVLNTFCFQMLRQSKIKNPYIIELKTNFCNCLPVKQVKIGSPQSVKSQEKVKYIFWSWGKVSEFCKEIWNFAKSPKTFSFIFNNSVWLCFQCELPFISHRRVWG